MLSQFSSPKKVDPAMNDCFSAVNHGLFCSHVPVVFKMTRVVAQALREERQMNPRKLSERECPRRSSWKKKKKGKCRKDCEKRQGTGRAFAEENVK